MVWGAAFLATVKVMIMSNLANYKYHLTPRANTDSYKRMSPHHVRSGYQRR